MIKNEFAAHLTGLKKHITSYFELPLFGFIKSDNDWF